MNPLKTIPSFTNISHLTGIHRGIKRWKNPNDAYEPYHQQFHVIIIIIFIFALLSLTSKTFFLAHATVHVLKAFGRQFYFQIYDWKCATVSKKKQQMFIKIIEWISFDFMSHH